MNKKNNRKGFTIVELVIVIAVIAILATVLVPTFGNVIDKAQASAALQEAKNIHTNYVANVDYANGKEANDTFYIVVKGGTYYVAVNNGVLETSARDASVTALPAGKTLTMSGDTLIYGHQGTPAVTDKCTWCGQKHTAG